MMLMTGERIAPAMRSGLIASEAVIQASESNRSAETHYLSRASHTARQDISTTREIV
jgi:flavin-dependent dehydrogenase